MADEAWGDTDDDEDVGVFPSRVLRPIDVMVTIFATAQEIVEAISQGLDKMVYLLAAHANHKNDQTKFADAQRLELDSLPTTED